MPLEEARIREEHLRPTERAIFVALRSRLPGDAFALSDHRDAILDVIDRKGTREDIPPAPAPIDVAREYIMGTLDLATPEDGRRVQNAISSVSIGGEAVAHLSTGSVHIVVRPGEKVRGVKHKPVSPT